MVAKALAISHFPLEILYLIVEHLDIPGLKTFRLACRDFHSNATPTLFRRIVFTPSLFHLIFSNNQKALRYMQHVSGLAHEMGPIFEVLSSRDHQLKSITIKITETEDEEHDLNESDLDVFMKNSPSLQVLNLQSECIDFDYSSIQHFAPSLTEITLDSDSPETNSMSFTAFRNILQTCPLLKKLHVTCEVENGLFQEDDVFPMMEDFTGYLAPDCFDYLFSLDTWKSVFPNLQEFCMDSSDGPWTMRTMNDRSGSGAWKSIKRFTVSVMTDLSLVDFAVALPNVVHLNIDRLEDSGPGIILVDTAKPDKEIFPYLETLCLVQVEKSCLSWLTSILQTRKPDATKLTGLYLSCFEPDCAPQLLELLLVVAEHLEIIKIGWIPSDFKPEWLLEFVWPESKPLKCKEMDFKWNTYYPKETKVEWEMTLDLLRARANV